MSEEQPQEKKSFQNTINYSIFGLFFGFIFPLVATLVDVSLQNLPGTFSSMVKVQSGNPLHWIIDTAPLFLGLLSALAGYLKDQTVHVNKELEQIVAKRTESIEKKNSLLKQEIEHRKKTESELVKAKEQAELGANAKTQFLSTMSHEIRTPLNAIIGMSGLLTDSMLNAEQRDFVRIIDKSGEDLLTIINNILDYIKIDSGNLELEEVEFSVVQLIKDVFDVVSTTDSKVNVELSYNIDERVPDYVIGDSARIRQILVHLVRNAVKFTDEGSVRVFVKSKFIGEESIELSIQVKDTGIGIPEDKQELLFKFFSQVDNSRTRKYGGTGLGLATCKKLAEIMDGEISIESEVGIGSTFGLSIMVQRSKINQEVINLIKREVILKGEERIVEEEKGLVTSEKKKGQDKKKSGQKLKILLAEDNDINQKVVGKMLKRFGQTCDVAGNGIEALEMCQLIAYDLVFMDMKMPEMDGIEATRELIKLETKLSKLPIIIAMTANVMEEDREKCIEAGMDDFLAKPVKLEELQAMIEKWFSKEA